MYSKEFSFECIRSQRATNGRKLGRVEHSPVLDVRKEEKKKKRKRKKRRSRSRESISPWDERETSLARKNKRSVALATGF